MLENFSVKNSRINCCDLLIELSLTKIIFHFGGEISYSDCRLCNPILPFLRLEFLSIHLSATETGEESLFTDRSAVSITPYDSCRDFLLFIFLETESNRRLSTLSVFVPTDTETFQLSCCFWDRNRRLFLSKEIKNRKRLMVFLWNLINDWKIIRRKTVEDRNLILVRKKLGKPWEKFQEIHQDWEGFWNSLYREIT